MKERKKKVKTLGFLRGLPVIAVLLLALLYGLNTGGPAEQVSEAGILAPEEVLQVHFLDVGQGDATLITLGKHAMLIDAGENDKGTAVQLYLEKQGVEALDYLIGTHPHSDHIGGLDVILTKFDVKTLILPEYGKETRTYNDVLQAMKAKNCRNTPPVAGDRYELGGASFTIVAPNRKDYGEETNNYSVGLLLQYGQNRFLFTGDAEDEAEEDMLDNGLRLSADVYQVGHHGSRTSSGREFLQAVSPAFAVISCGAYNSYGFPHAQTMNSLRAMGVRVFRTDEQGTVVAESDGTRITWNCAPAEDWTAGEPRGSDGEKVPGGLQGTEAEEAARQEVSAEGTYILNRKSKRFHVPSCSSVQEMDGSNRQVSELTREELIAEGYTPCKRCSP